MFTLPEKVFQIFQPIHSKHHHKSYSRDNNFSLYISSSKNRRKQSFIKLESYSVTATSVGDLTFNKAIMVTTGRAQCIHNCIFSFGNNITYTCTYLFNLLIFFIFNFTYCECLALLQHIKNLII